VTRLFDLGVKPFLVASALRAVVAQRLVRRMCPRCVGARAACGPGPADPAAATPVGVGAAACPECGGTGYAGRLGIFEFFSVDAALQQLIHERAGGAALRVRARAQGMATLREDGLRKARAGLTTVDEVLAATVADAN
jgi:type II secretory ATPase GspE/PulE/Tfp pilus assembly ATPase PilB-like protein